MFRLLRVTPAIGRFFVEGEDAAGAPPAVVLSDRVWRDRFGADPAAVGRTLEIDGERRTIVGIARPDLAFPNPRVLFWIPATIPADADQANRTVVFTTLGRLRPGATPEQAEAEGTAAARSMPRPRSTDFFFGRGGAVVVRARPLVDDLTLTVRPAILVLATAVALVLLIACANVANLLLSRGAARQRELTIRAALGSSRTRLVRQLLTESLVLSAAGGSAGIALAWTLVRLLPLAAPARFPRLEAITLDGTTLVFGVAASVAAAVVSGLVPALRSTRADLFQAFRSGEGSVSASTNAPHTRRLRLGLLIVEAAFAVVLAVGASLLAQSFLRLTRVDAGYDPDQVEVMRVQLPEGKDLDVRSHALITRLLERIRATPGVASAGASNMLALMPMTAVTGVTLPAAVGGGKPTSGRVLSYVVTPGYAEAMQLRLKDGRFFDERDTTSGERAVIVNQEFVRQFLSGPRAVGMRLGPLYEGEYAAETEIIGVVGDVLKDGNDATRQPEMYFVHGSRTHRISGFPTFVVRGSVSHPELTATLRRLVHEIDAGTAIESCDAAADAGGGVVGAAAFRRVGRIRLCRAGDRPRGHRPLRRAVVQRVAAAARTRRARGAWRHAWRTRQAGAARGGFGDTRRGRARYRCCESAHEADDETALRHVAARRTLVLARPGTLRHRRHCSLPRSRAARRIDRSCEGFAGRMS